LLDDPVQRSAWRDAQRPAAKMAELRFARSHAEHAPELGRSHFDIAVRWIARGPVWKAQETDVLAASVVQRQGRTLRRCKVCHEAPGAQASRGSHRHPLGTELPWVELQADLPVDAVSVLSDVDDGQHGRASDRRKTMPR